MTHFFRAPRLPLSALVVLVAVTLTMGAVAAPARADPGDPIGVWPLQPTPTVVRGFEPPSSTYGAGHRGVDLLGRPGEPVHAALAGRITFAGSLAGRGVVVVDHGSTRTTYEPVVASVHVGDRVTRGQVIGVLAVAASHCFPRACLHWGWIAGETYLDPLRLVGGGPVRLLPLVGRAGLSPAGAGPATVGARYVLALRLALGWL